MNFEKIIKLVIRIMGIYILESYLFISLTSIEGLVKSLYFNEVNFFRLIMDAFFVFISIVGFVILIKPQSMMKKIKLPSWDNDFSGLYKLIMRATGVLILIHNGFQFTYQLTNIYQNHYMNNIIGLVLGVHVLFLVIGIVFIRNSFKSNESISS